MVLSSLQDQSHVASLLGYSNFGEVTALGPPLTPAMSVRPPSSSSSVEAYDPLHLAEVLLRTLLLSIGFYTVWQQGSSEFFSSHQLGVHCFLSNLEACFHRYLKHIITVRTPPHCLCVLTGEGIWGTGEKQ